MKDLVITITPEIAKELLSAGNVRAMVDGFGGTVLDSFLIGMLKKLSDGDVEWTPKKRNPQPPRSEHVKRSV